MKIPILWVAAWLGLEPNPRLPHSEEAALATDRRDGLLGERAASCYIHHGDEDRKNRGRQRDTEIDGDNGQTE